MHKKPRESLTSCFVAMLRYEPKPGIAVTDLPPIGCVQDNIIYPFFAGKKRRNPDSELRQVMMADKDEETAVRQ